MRKEGFDSRPELPSVSEGDTSGIVAKLEGATGPDRKLDAMIWYAVVERLAPGSRPDPDMIGRLPRYTGSVDDALSLAAHVYPEMQWSAHPGDAGVTMGFHVPRGFGAGEKWGTAPTAPIALLIAVFRTLQNPATPLTSAEGVAARLALGGPKPTPQGKDT